MLTNKRNSTESLTTASGTLSRRTPGSGSDMLSTMTPAPQITHPSRSAARTRVRFLRDILFASLLAITSATIVAPSFARTNMDRVGADGQSAPDRYCLQGPPRGWPGECEYSTYQQCKATASGVGGLCVENPEYLFPEHWRGY
ncbi:DUF3551 domain-containing protein [Bradyrhizobium sp. USDA 3315]